MNFSYEDLLSIDEVIADVLLEVDDVEQRKLTPGYYVSQVKYALDELGFATFFVDVTRDVIMPHDLLIEWPKGCFNLDKIWAYTGTPDDVQYKQPVYWKRNFNTRGKDTGYTADSNEGNISDPFIIAPSHFVSELFFNVRAGIIHLSDTCDVYDYIRLQFAGTPSSVLDVAKIKIVPPMVRKAVEQWVVERAAKALKGKYDTARDQKYRRIQSDAAIQLDEYGLNGAWHEAKMRLKKVDTKMMNDFIEYNSKMTA